MCRLKERKNLLTPLYFLLFCNLMRNIPFYSAVYLLCELWPVVLWGAAGYLWCHADWLGNQAIQIPEPRGVSCKLFLPRMDFNTTYFALDMVLGTMSSVKLMMGAANSCGSMPAVRVRWGYGISNLMLMSDFQGFPASVESGWHSRMLYWHWQQVPHLLSKWGGTQTFQSSLPKYKVKVHNHNI